MVANIQNNEPELTIVQPVGLPMKMVKIMGAVGNVAKGGTNSQQGYKFMQSDDVLDAIRVEMVKNNVAVFAKAIGYELTEGTTKSGNPNYHAVVQFEFMLVDADSGETMSCTWYGESIDTSDKSFSKAGTSAMKYWLLKTFMISAGEPDADTDTPERSPKAALKGNGQSDRRIPPKTAQNAPKANVVSNGGNSNTGEPSDAWEEPFVKQFIKHYEGRADVNELLAMLKVKRFGEWKNGGIAAYKVIDGALSIRNMEF
jgi:ERF superfamily protein